MGERWLRYLFTTPKVMYCKISQDPAEVIPYLNEGRLIAFPTDTSYGLAANALRGFALQRVRNLKRRPADKPFSVFMAERLWPEFLLLTDPERQFITKLTNQPVTILVKPVPDLSHLAQDGLLALRMIDHPLMRELASLSPVPLTATSANPAGKSPALSPKQIQAYFPGRVDDTTYDLSLAAILDAGTLPDSPPSTIVYLEPKNNTIEIIRPGKISVEQIRSL